jgi:hypothetical protein
MIQLTPVHLPDRCANLACPNKPHEGQFTLLETEGNAVGGHRPIRLWMCHPCAAALVNGPTTPPADNWPSTSSEAKGDAFLQGLDAVLRTGEYVGVDYHSRNSINRSYGRLINVTRRDFQIVGDDETTTICKDVVLRIWSVHRNKALSSPVPEYIREADLTWRTYQKFPTEYSGTVYAPPLAANHVHDTDPGGNCRHPDCGYYRDMAVVLDEDRDDPPW